MGPVWKGGKCGEPELLAACYESSLTLAAAHNLRSVAFPAISTGAYGYPLKEATAIAVQTVRASAVQYEQIQEVIFCCYSGEHLAAYQRQLRTDQG